MWSRKIKVSSVRRKPQVGTACTPTTVLFLHRVSGLRKIGDISRSGMLSFANRGVSARGRCGDGEGPTKITRTAMAKTRGTGLLMVWTDVDSEFEAEFN